MIIILGVLALNLELKWLQCFGPVWGPSAGIYHNNLREGWNIEVIWFLDSQQVNSSYEKLWVRKHVICRSQWWNYNTILILSINDAAFDECVRNVSHHSICIKGISCIQKQYWYLSKPIFCSFWTSNNCLYINGLVQERCNSIANALV